MNVKPLVLKKRSSSCFRRYETSSRGCGNCGNGGKLGKERSGLESFPRFPQFPQPAPISITFGLTSALLQPKERLTAIRGTTQMVVTLSWMRPSLGRSRKPRVLCLQKRISQLSYGCSLLAMSRRSLGPPVSSAVKGAAELSTRNSYGRCSFNTA